METPSHLAPLFQPIKLGSVEIKNRIVLSPMAVEDGSPEGYPTEQTIAFNVARAKGGVGLIVLGGCVSTRRAWKESPYGGGYRLDIEEAVPALRRLVDAVHTHDTKIFAEPMTSFGRLGSSRGGLQPIAPSVIPLVIPEDSFPEIMAVPGGRTMQMPREVTVPEIVALEDETAMSAVIARQAGFDGVEIGAHMSYLVTSFLSQRSNKRTDDYGGSPENRMRFLLNIVKKTRELVGDHYPMGVKLICNEHLDDGLSIQDCLEIGLALERAGVDYLSLSDGTYENQRLSVPSEDGALLKHGEPQAFRQELRVPIVVPSIHDPYRAADALAAGHADMISLGRPLLADPEWPNKAREGRVDEIRCCDRDNYCIVRLMTGMRPHCKINPEMGRESGPYPLSLRQKVRERAILAGVTTPSLARLAHALHLEPH
ncbi:MAG: NADH:flavin oxidoreductase [Actinobacteria bacterium]|nr:NADH:flavin oxidoreductase [Actinomycetota bacterium]